MLLPDELLRMRLVAVGFCFELEVLNRLRRSLVV